MLADAIIFLFTVQQYWNNTECIADIYRKLRQIVCFANFDRIRGWFDTTFQDHNTFTVSA